MNQYRFVTAAAESRVEPAQTSPFYAAPEVLDSLLCDPSGTSSRLVNGAAADVWSTGIILLEALTGQVVFDKRSRFSGPNTFSVPDFVSTEHRKTWKKYAEVRQLQKLWVSFCHGASFTCNTTGKGGTSDTNCDCMFQRGC